MPRRLPALAIILGVAGIIPFLICGIGATAANDVRSTLAAFALVGYGAVILGFLGGVHWGFTLSVEHDPAERLRLGFGVLPAIIGWLALGISLVTVHPVLSEQSWWNGAPTPKTWCPTAISACASASQPWSSCC
jgi:hypothetical protein